MGDTNDEFESRSVKVSASSIMGVRVRPSESLEDAVNRELDEEMTPERAVEFFRDRLSVEVEGENEGPW